MKEYPQHRPREGEAAASEDLQKNEVKEVIKEE